MTGGLDAEGRGNDGLPGRTIPDRVASLSQRFCACRAENRATHAAARLERRIRGVDDGVGLDGGDITLNNLDDTWGAGSHSR